MNQEIERKFIVVDAAWRESRPAATAFDIEQAYVCTGAGKSVRVRIVDNTATLTIKGATEGYTRAEFEYDIPLDDARALLGLCQGYPIAKRRYTLEFEGKDWIVDEFSGENAGLVVAEIELDDEAESFGRPDWLGEEVSDKPEYFNSSLATRPYASWASVEDTAAK